MWTETGMNSLQTRKYKYPCHSWVLILSQSFQTCFFPSSLFPLFSLFNPPFSTKPSNQSAKWFPCHMTTRLHSCPVLIFPSCAATSHATLLKHQLLIHSIVHLHLSHSRMPNKRGKWDKHCTTNKQRLLIHLCLLLFKYTKNHVINRYTFLPWFGSTRHMNTSARMSKLLRT